MAIVKCSACKQDVSAVAELCPHCGHPQPELYFRNNPDSHVICPACRVKNPPFGQYGTYEREDDIRMFLRGDIKDFDGGSCRCCGASLREVSETFGELRLRALDDRNKQKMVWLIIVVPPIVVILFCFWVHMSFGWNVGDPVLYGLYALVLGFIASFIYARCHKFH